MQFGDTADYKSALQAFAACSRLVAVPSLARATVYRHCVASDRAKVEMHTFVAKLVRLHRNRHQISFQKALKLTAASRVALGTP